MLLIHTFQTITDAALPFVEHVLRGSSSSSGMTQALWLSPVVTGPAAGGGVYHVVRTRYRNQNATYVYEREARVEVTNPMGADEHVRTRNKTRDRNVQNWEQSRDPRTRVHGKPEGLDGFLGMFD